MRTCPGRSRRCCGATAVSRSRSRPTTGPAGRAGSRPAGCWRSPTCAAAASSAPSGTRRAGWSAKQNVFDDFIAVAEHLIESGVTTPAQLAIHGRSNGGLLVGAVMTQRPDLVGGGDPRRRRARPAALPPVHHRRGLDVRLRQSRRSGAVRRPRWRTHRCTTCEAGTEYPATLVLTGDHDDRVVPLHSHKFTAALQHAQAGDRADPDPDRDRHRPRHGEAVGPGRGRVGRPARLRRPPHRPAAAPLTTAAGASVSHVYVGNPHCTQEASWVQRQETGYSGCSCGLRQRAVHLGDPFGNGCQWTGVAFTS